MCCRFIFCVCCLGGGLRDSRGIQAIWSTFHQEHSKWPAWGVQGRLWARVTRGAHFSLGLGELEVLAWLIRPFISPLGMFEGAGQGLKSACFGGNSRLAGEAWWRVHVGVLFRLPPVQRPQDGSVGRFQAHSLSNEHSLLPGWIPVPGVNRRNWTVFPVDRLRRDTAPEGVVVRPRCLNNLVASK